MQRSGFVLVVAYGGVNQQLTQVSDALVLGQALGAIVILPELLVHHWWNDSLRLSSLIDVAHWRRSAAQIGVRVVAPEELRGDVAAWYALCGRRGPLPDPGQTSAACKPYHVSLPKGGSLVDAGRLVAPILQRHGMVTVTTLKRMHEPVANAVERMPIQLMHLFSHFIALREHVDILRVVGSALNALPRSYVAVHIRQELDILAISGCINSSDPRFAAAEQVIRQWGGWAARPLRGAVARRAKFANSTSAMRAAGVCGVSASALAELLTALAPSDVPPSAVYVCGARDGLEPLSRAGFDVWTQHRVLSQAELRRWGGHASFLALFDAAISTRARVFIAARGNFDRTVIAKRALRGRSTIESHQVYFSARRSPLGFRRYVQNFVASQQEALAIKAPRASVSCCRLPGTHASLSLTRVATPNPLGPHLDGPLQPKPSPSLNPSPNPSRAAPGRATCTRTRSQLFVHVVGSSTQSGRAWAAPTWWPRRQQQWWRAMRRARRRRSPNKPEERMHAVWSELLRAHPSCCLR